MAILQECIEFYREIFDLPNFFSEPVLTIGVQEIRGDNLPKDFDFRDLNELLLAKGIKNFETLDLFDERADFQYDLNHSVPKKLHEKYNTLIDIGSLEHVFDTRQAFENYLRMLKPGGIFFLHTPVNGFFKHGLHTFNPDGLITALELNGFKIIYEKYSTVKGNPIQDPSVGKHVNIWLVAKKIKKINEFIIPQQDYWTEYLKEHWKTSWKEREKRKTNYLKKLKHRIKSIWYACDLI